MRKITLLLALALLFAAPAWAVQFVHSEHLGYLEGFEQPVCTNCHVEGAKEIIPDLSQCLNCHDQDTVNTFELPGPRTHGPTWALSHGLEAKRGAIDCSACHRQSDCLECHQSGFANEFGEFGSNMINVHRSEFLVTHPIAARTEPQLCSSCHEPKFCSSCHDDFRNAGIEPAFDSHRRGWQVLNFNHNHDNLTTCQTCHPDSVLPSQEWHSRHSREARKNLATCQACHPEGDICISCHSAKTGLGVNPHPKDWDDFDGRLKRAGNGKTCRNCH